jgi:hypothetical protein
VYLRNIQLGPVLELWQQLTSTNASILKSSGPAAAAAKAQGDQQRSAPEGNSLDDFVHMENELSTQMCLIVDNSVGALKKVC